MNKFYLVTLMLYSLGFMQVKAQENGGLPWSFQPNSVSGEIIDVSTEVINLAALDLDRLAIEDEETENSGIGPYRIGRLTETDIDITNSGKFIYLADGKIIWAAQAKIENALAIDAYLDKFTVPEGVTLYFYNQNRKQVSGGFDNSSMNEYSTLRSEYIQGETIFMELNIQPWVNLNDIQFHVNQLGAAYRGGRTYIISYLFGDENNESPLEFDTKNMNQIGPVPDKCHTNANCDGWGTSHYKLKQTAVQLDMGSYICSGNLINNTNLDCSPLFITASHCDAANAKNDAHFSNWRFYFNYESKNCNGTGIGGLNDFVTGAKFVARADHSLPSLKADWLLLRLTAPISTLASKNLYLGGWDKSGTLSADKQWIAFHHPAGYMKKVSVTNKIFGNGTFNQNAVPNTHWRVDSFIVGGTQGGSSGSALFTSNNFHIIGVLTGGPASNDTSECKNRKTKGALYSKIDRAWENTQGEGGSTPTSRLREHLDPAGTDQKTLGTMKLTGTECGADVSVQDFQILNNGILISPNPSKGLVNVKINIPSEEKLTIDVYNLLGQKVATYNVGQAKKTDVSLDMHSFASGIYMLSISTEKTTVTKKVIIKK